MMKHGNLIAAAALCMCTTIDAKPVTAQTTETATEAPVSTASITVADPATSAPNTATQAILNEQTSETSASIPASTVTTPAVSAIDNPTSVTLPDGVIYQVLKEGTGPVASSTQTLVLHYTLYLPNGKKVESSRDQEFPVPLHLKPGQGDFIVGVEKGAQGMRVGEIRKLYVPASLAYGEAGKDKIPPNTPLLFEIELVDIL